MTKLVYGDNNATFENLPLKTGFINSRFSLIRSHPAVYHKKRYNATTLPYRKGSIKVFWNLIFPYNFYHQPMLHNYRKSYTSPHSCTFGHECLMTV
jgi:hypothetical protein